MLRAARFIAGYGLAARRRRWSPRSTALRDRLEIVSRRAHPRRAVQAAGRRRPERRACGSWPTPACPTSSCPSCRRMRLEQDPIHRHKDVLAHTIAVVAKTSRPEPASCGWPRCCTTSASPRPGRSGRRGVTFHHHEVVGRPHGPRPAAGAALPERRRRRRAAGSCSSTCGSTATATTVWTDTAVRRYVRDAGPLLDELNELTRCDCTTRNERKARHAGRAHGRARGPHRRAARARRSWTPSAPTSTATR